MAADNEIQVLLTAQISELQAGMDAGAESVATSTAAMTAAMEEAAAATTAATAAIGESAEAAAARIKAMVAASMEQVSANGIVGESERSLAERMGLRIEMTQAQAAAIAESIAAQDAQMVSTEGFIGTEGAAVAATDAATVAITENTAAMAINGGVARELGVLTGEALRGNWTRLEGSSITLANRMNLLQYAFTPVGMSAIAAGAAVIGFGAEMLKGAEYSNEFNKALASSGGYLGVTEGQFNGMADAIAGGETTIGTAREAVMKLADSGRFSGQAMQDAGKAAVDFAALTGESIDQAVAAVIKIQEKPVQALEKLNEQYHFLTLAQLEHIQKLQDEGDAVGAATEAVKLFGQTSADRLQKADQDVGLLVQSWRGLKGAISAAADAVQDFGKKQSDQAKFDELDARRDRLLKDQAGGATFDVNSGQDIQEMIDKTTAQMAAMQDARVAQEKLTAAKVAGQKVQDAGIAARGEIEYLQKAIKGTDAYAEALDKALAALKATHAANAGDASLKGIKFDDGGNASGGAGLDAIKEALHKKFDAKQAGAKQERQSLEEQLKLEEAAEQVSNANKLAFELSFWTRKLAELKTGSAEYAQAYAQVNRITQQVDAEKRRSALAAAQAAQQAAQTEAGISINAAQSQLAIEKEKIQSKVALGQASAAQETAMLTQAYERQYQVEVSALQREMTLLAAKPKMVAQINKEIEKLQDQHNLQMLKMENKAALDNQQMWQARLKPISQAFNQSINGMIQGTQTLRQSMARIGDGIVAKFAQMGIDMVVKWVANEAAKTTATTVGAASRTIVEQTAAQASKAADAATGKSQITSAAATGAAKAYQAIVGIPYVGPVLAPIAAGVAFAGIEAFSGMISSARGGWDRVPFDGAMTELHKDEMVLPAHIANPMRQMAQNGGQGGGQNITIQATDARSLKDLLRRNPGALASAMKHANRRGHFN